MTPALVTSTPLAHLRWDADPLPAQPAGGRPMVLMLHGVGGGRQAWDVSGTGAALAAAGFTALAADFPGYGLSATVQPYDLAGMAGAVLDTLAHLGGVPVVLVGHSMGGMVAQEVVARRPDLVRRLVLCGTSAAFGKRSDGRSAEAWAQQFIGQRTAPLDAGQTMADMAARLVPQMVGPGSLPEGLRLAEHCMAGVPAATYRRALECLVTFDRQAALAHIRVPTLLVGGEFDRVAAPAVLKQMAAAIPRARYAELAGIGHLMNLEAPDEFDALLIDFLREPTPKPLPDTH